MDIETKERITRNEGRLNNLEGWKVEITSTLEERKLTLKKVVIIIALGTTLLGTVTWAQNAYFQNENDKRYVLPYQIAGSITQNSLEHTLDERELQNISNEINFLQDKKKYVSPEFTTADEFQLGRLIKKKTELENKLYRGRQ